jgi:glutathione peroxidase
METKTLYDYSVVLNNGKEHLLKVYRGKVLLIVNVASHCGLTPQYKGLETLYRKYQDRGFFILGFPCDQFAHQEPGTDEEIKSFCEMNFGVTFPLYRKIEVNGNGTHPLYAFLKNQAPGFLNEAIKWNFTKFLVDREGRVVDRFAPTTTPENIETEVLKYL